jgi:hypothetical protein
MEKQLLEVIEYLKDRSETLRSDVALKKDIEGLDEHENHIIRQFNMGTACGIDLAILALKRFILNIEPSEV